MIEAPEHWDQNYMHVKLWKNVLHVKLSDDCLYDQQSIGENVYPTHISFTSSWAKRKEKFEGGRIKTNYHKSH